MSRFLEALKQLDQRSDFSVGPGRRVTPRLSEAVRKAVLPEESLAAPVATLPEPFPLVFQVPSIEVAEVESTPSAGEWIDGPRDPLQLIDQIADAISEATGVQSPFIISPDRVDPTFSFKIPSQPTMAAPSSPALRVERRPATAAETAIFAELRDAERSQPYRSLLRAAENEVPVGETPFVCLFSIEPTPETGSIAARLASLFAEAHERRILLVDLNFSTREVSTLYGMDIQPGMAEFLERQATPEELPIPTSLDTMSVAPCGQADLQSGMEKYGLLNDIFTAWRHKYSAVVVDGGSLSSPLAPMLARKANACYVAIAGDRESNRIANEEIQRFRSLGGNLHGCIMLSGMENAA